MIRFALVLTEGVRYPALAVTLTAMIAGGYRLADRVGDKNEALALWFQSKGLM